MSDIWNLRFAKKGSLPKHGLVSFPRSGNTWIRYLIEAATGWEGNKFQMICSMTMKVFTLMLYILSLTY